MSTEMFFVWLFGFIMGAAVVGLMNFRRPPPPSK